jgi:hypothetical protein
MWENGPGLQTVYCVPGAPGSPSAGVCRLTALAAASPEQAPSGQILERGGAR